MLIISLFIVYIFEILIYVSDIDYCITFFVKSYCGFITTIQHTTIIILNNLIVNKNCTEIISFNQNINKLRILLTNSIYITKIQSGNPLNTNSLIDNKNINLKLSFFK